MRTTSFRLALLSAVWLAVALASPAAAQPVHDNWVARKAIAALPYSDTEANPASATTEAIDPTLICRIGPLTQGADSVWYRYTTGAAVEYVDLATANSTYDTVISVYTGTPGNFRLIHGGCNDNGEEAQTWGRISGLRLQASTTYSIEVAASTAASAGNALAFSMTAAPQYAVTTNSDTFDGVCDANCSLRDAIVASNTLPGAVLVPAGTYLLTLLGAFENSSHTGGLDLTKGMGMYGAGATATIIDGNAYENVLLVHGAVTAILGDLTLTNGGNIGVQRGGGILASSTSFLAADRIVVSNSHMFLAGGGIFSGGRGTLWNSTVDGNSGGGGGGGGGGLFLAGDANTTFEIRDSTISNNLGGYIFDDSPFSGGGGIHTHSRLVLINSTVSGNTAYGAGSGGGILVDLGTSAFIASSTIVNNRADANSINSSGNGGGLAIGGPNSTGTLVIHNSVIADNLDASGPAAHPDCTVGAGGASITSSYDHLEATAGGCTFTGTGDVTGSDPALNPNLTNNGGPTNTHLIGVGSPLIDAGDPAGCTDDHFVLFALDQRLQQRAFDGDGNASAICDKGAVEFVNGAPVELLGFSVE